MYIDPHVHCRDAEESYKDTIKHILTIAETTGFTAIFDMPNSSPPVLTYAVAVDRISYAESLRKKHNFQTRYYTYMGVTNDTEQIKRAISTTRILNNIIGLKLFAGQSNKSVSVPRLEDQEMVYQTLAREGYTGVLALHCEKEAYLTPSLWNPDNPITHAFARPPKAEYASVHDQLLFAKAAAFKGTLHIAHVSTPEAVDLIRSEPDIHVTCGITPHHLFLDYTLMQDDSSSSKMNGLLWKVNPPLRAPGTSKILLEQLRTGKIDWIETDHAPHTLEEKINPPHLSGITSLQHYPRFIALLKKNKFTDERIHEITFATIANTFKLSIPQRQCTPKVYDQPAYSFDPWLRLF